MGDVSRLSRISTDTGMLNAAFDGSENAQEQLVLRYQHAISSYLAVKLRDLKDHAAVEDLTHDILLNLVGGKYHKWNPEIGRFRHYLKTAVKNAAVDYARSRRKTLGTTVEDLEESFTTEDSDWDETWIESIMQRSFKALRKHDRRSTGAGRPRVSIYYHALQIHLENPKISAKQLASALKRKTRQKEAISDALARKYLERARRKFAELLANEIRTELPLSCTDDNIVDELRELGLYRFVDGYWPN